MSDIYLQIAETPTVVTLSAPVVSGALSSTVTVANTVTVALDANSLSALENVTVTVGAAVSISNFPATQNVAGTVTANVDANSLVAALDAFGAGYTERFPVGIDQTGFGNVPISGTVTVGNSVTIGSCVTHGVTIANTSVTVNVNPQISFYNEETDSYAVRCSLAYLDGGDMLDVTESRPFPITVGNSVNIGSCVTHGVTIANTSVTVNGTFYQATQPVSLASVPTHGVTLASTTVTVSSLPALAAGTAQIGSVTASISGTVPVSGTFYQATQPVSLASVPTHGVTLASTTVTVSSLPALAAGTNQIGSVTASISGTVPVSISSVTVGNSVTIGSIPAISGTVTANTFAIQGTAVTTSNFTSTTASTVLANNNATRRVLTIFNEGAGNLHICPGATCTTVAYQVRLSAGDYYEVPNHQTTVTHSAVFATAGTARVTEVY
ncbi:MAG: hypothetical protein EBT03_11655 [Betaproteobacteria bacterium]|nr:hypothetical protein [Betaproteobacteria bacterium]